MTDTDRARRAGFLCGAALQGALLALLLLAVGAALAVQQSERPVTFRYTHFLMLFFGVGTGRCGTMALANALDAEPGVRCLHEGLVREGTRKGAQWLPFLTLQQLAAFHDPAQAEPLLRRARGDMDAKRREAGLEALGDVAYNYAPFVGALARAFPAARLLAIVRDGREFVRSAYTDEVPDPTPVGWLDPGRPETREERYVALGRLRPADSDAPDGAWARMTPLERNAWLWAETNRAIEDGLAAWDPARVHRIRFEAFFADPLVGYARVREFLGLRGPVPEAAAAVFARPLNARARRVLPPPAEWSAEQEAQFQRWAGAMSAKLGY